MPDAILLPGNDAGYDYVMGDIHGRLKRLELIDNKMTLKDRLFLVGDLTDRGPQSIEVIEKIQAMRKAGKQVFVVYGNHEDMCMQTIRALEDIANNFLKKAKNTSLLKANLLISLSAQASRDNAIQTHKANGGDWLYDLFFQELREGKIYIGETNSLVYRPESKVLLVLKEMGQLPTIIRVTASTRSAAFNVVHADLPFNDQQLLALIQQRDRLTDEQRYYALWARPEEIRLNGRSWLSAITYCGHTIFLDGMPIRESISAVDIDGGQLCVIINHTTKDVTAVNDANVSEDEFLGQIRDIRAYLENRDYFEYAASHINQNCHSLLEVERFLTNLDEKKNGPDIDLIEYLINQDLLVKYGVTHSNHYRRQLVLEERAHRQQSHDTEGQRLVRDNQQGTTPPQNHAFFVDRRKRNLAPPQTPNETKKPGGPRK